MEVSGQLYAPSTLPPRKKTTVPIRWEGPRAGLDAVEKINIVPTGNRTPVVPPVASRYSENHRKHKYTV
jgi:hypothetical protein